MKEPRTKDFRRTTFGPGHRIVLVALAEALFSEDGDVPAERMASFAADVDGFVSPASRPLRVGLVMMLRVIQLAPLFLFFSFSLFENLPVKKRVELLDRMDRSSIGFVALVLVAYRTIMTMVFYEDPHELSLLGYPGDERKVFLRFQSKKAKASALLHADEHEASEHEAGEHEASAPHTATADGSAE